MSLKENMENRARPVILHEMIPPKVGAVEELEKKLDSIRGLAGKVDGTNIPEIHEETRRRARQARLPGNPGRPLLCHTLWRSGARYSKA